MKVFVGVFGQTPCEIHVTAHAGPNGPAYSGVPLVVEKGGPELRQQATEQGDIVELVASTEAGAVDRAGTFLNRRFGPDLGVAESHREYKSPRQVLPPQKRSAAATRVDARTRASYANPCCEAGASGGSVDRVR